MESKEAVAIEIAPTPSASIVGSSLSVSFWTAISRATGFGKLAAIAAVLGPTYLGNIFQATNVLPNVVYYHVLAGSLLPSLLVPPLVRHLDRNDRARAQHLAGSFFGLALVAFSAGTLLFIVGGPILVALLSIGVRDATAAVAQREVGQALLVMIMPQVVLYGVAGTSGAVMNAHGRFALAAAAPAVENIGIIGTLASSALLFGTGTPLEEVPGPQLLLLGLGTTGSVGLHAALQLLGVRRLGFSLIPRAQWRDPEVRQILVRSLPSLGHAGLYALQYFVMMAVANTLPGGVVALELAWGFYTLPIALAANPVALTLLPQLARFHHGGNVQRFRDELVRGLRFAFFLTVPAALAYVVLAVPLAKTVSFGEMADPRAVGLVATSLAALAVGVLGETGFLLATNASYARHDARAAFLAMAVRTSTSLVGMMIAFHLRELAVLLVLGAAISAGDVAGALFLAARMRTVLPRTGEALLSPLIRNFLAAALAIGPAYLVADGLPRLITSDIEQLFGMCAAASAGAGIYVILQKWLGAPELSALTSLITNLTSKRRVPQPELLSSKDRCQYPSNYSQ